MMILNSDLESGFRKDFLVGFESLLTNTGQSVESRYLFSLTNHCRRMCIRCCGIFPSSLKLNFLCVNNFIIEKDKYIYETNKHIVSLGIAFALGEHLVKAVNYP